MPKWPKLEVPHILFLGILIGAVLAQLSYPWSIKVLVLGVVFWAVLYALMILYISNHNQKLEQVRAEFEVAIESPCRALIGSDLFVLGDLVREIQDPNTSEARKADAVELAARVGKALEDMFKMLSVLNPKQGETRRAIFQREVWKLFEPEEDQGMVDPNKVMQFLKRINLLWLFPATTKEGQNDL